MKTKKQTSCWHVRHLNTAEREGKADDPSTPYGKLFQSKRLAYLWEDHGSRANGIGIVLVPKGFSPCPGDVVKLPDPCEEMEVIRVDGDRNRKMHDVYLVHQTKDNQTGAIK